MTDINDLVHGTDFCYLNACGEILFVSVFSKIC